MAKKPQQATRGGDQQTGYPAWMWLGSGVLLGLLIAGVALYKDWVPALRGNDLPQPNPQAQAPRASEAGVAPETAPKVPVETKPKYDFYSVLPEMEVVVPQEEIAEQSQTPGVTPEAGVRYVLQAGSFKAQGDAEAMKAKLALLGLRANVVAVTINDTTWHRVRVGPYANARELDEGLRTLQANGVQAIALRETQ
jgi:cell division protein FtsN